MSRFSSIDGQHTALRDLERQRLEKLMGQLRREVEPSAKAGRFQPPKRPERERPKRVVVAKPEEKPNAEMAWLLRASERFEAEAAEVRSFLVEHGLEQYAPLLEDCGVSGSSMEALRSATPEFLEQAGLPDSPRRRLQLALQGDSDSEERPMSEEGEGPRSAQWGRLGRLPAGWHRCGGERPRVATRSVPVSHSDAAVGDDSPVAASPVKKMAEVAAGAEAPAPASVSKIGSQASPAGASSRPGSAAGKAKGCCYQCYRQLYLSSALRMEEGSRPSSASAQVFCSDACMDNFRQALVAQSRRASELWKLREAVGQGAEPDAPTLHAVTHRR
ncbi:unnamed protein product [Effrenium voratum]|uniref:SAM domain-containing protein n=1 Tax=Effrenium voratum TaxID=2562239 RepID=A0AA36JCP6_9DINO|nr:unnamed protein product [Effrenium voratum]